MAGSLTMILSPMGSRKKALGNAGAGFFAAAPPWGFTIHSQAP